MSVPQQHIERSARTEKRPPAGRIPARLQHPRLAALAALGAGVVAVAAGAGIGIRHLQKTGLTVETVAGFALLAVGLMMTSSGHPRCHDKS